MNIDQLVAQIEKRFIKAELFYGHGTDNARDEAVVLVFEALQLPFDVDDQTLELFKLTVFQQQCIEDIVRRRIATRKPLAYLTHTAYFAGRSFYVDERVIIPRSSFAELIEHQFQPWINPKKTHRILDLCTGSGCMAIACAKELPQAQIDAVELSTDALEVAKINIEKHQVAYQVHVRLSDLYDQLQNVTYDLIISNPPYVSESEMKTLPEEYHHEPKMALEAREEGLEVVIRILKGAPAFLSEKGTLIVEVGNSEEALAQRFPQVPFTWLEFEKGDGGVFLLTADEVRCHFAG